jgi:hypothetical protein
MSARDLAMRGQPSRPAVSAARLPAAGGPGAAPSGSRANVTRVREALRSLIDLSLLSRREVEKRLAASGGSIDVTRLLAGRFEIKLRHVFDLLQVIEIHPLEFFRLIFKEPSDKSALLQRVEAVFAPRAPVAPRATPAPAAGDVEQLRQSLEQLQREVARLSADIGETRRPGDSRARQPEPHSATADT